MFAVLNCCRVKSSGAAFTSFAGLLTRMGTPCLLLMQASQVQLLCASSASGGNSRLSCFAFPFAQQQQQQQQPGFIQQQQQLPCLLASQPMLPFSLQQQQQQLVPQLGGVRTFVLMPRRIKYRKAHKSMGFNETICPNTRQLAFGLYGIRAMEHCRIPARTLEAAR